MSEFRPPAVVRADADTLAFRAADDDAIRALSRRYGGLVFTITGGNDAIVQGGEFATPADAAVHTFLQAWSNAEVFEPGRSFGPWLGSLAAECAASHRAGRATRISSTGCWPTRPRGSRHPTISPTVSWPPSWPKPPWIRRASTPPTTCVRRRPRRVRHGRSAMFVLGAAGAGLVLVVGILLLSAIGGTGTRLATIELRPTGRLTDVSGSIEVQSVEAGVRIVLDAPSLPDLGTGVVRGSCGARRRLDAHAGTFTEEAVWS